MKRLIPVLLAAALLLTGCAVGGGKPADNSYRLGVGGDLGITVSENGGAVEATWAAVTLDAAGRIVRCDIDAFNIKVESGKDPDLRSKNEMKEDYGMVAWAGAEKEWYQQVDIFCRAVEGRTLEEVMSLRSGNEQDLTAGCTIALDPLQHAVAKAVLQAQEQPLSADDSLTLKLKAGVTPDGESYSVAIDAAAVTMADGKATGCMVDSIQGTLSAETGSQYDHLSKRELGYHYGMAAVTGKLEWFEQMDALQQAVIGKTADGVTAIAVNGKVDPSLDLAGKATIYIGGTVALIAAAMA